MEYYGFRGIVLDWFKSYLKNRYQSVVIEGMKSNPLLMKYGVPQGSVLGPLLFLIYINDLQFNSKFSHTLFADDTCLFMSHKDPIILETLIGEEINKVNNWLIVNHLSLNLTKSNFLLFTGRKRVENFQICISGKPLQRVKQSKYLGVIIDDKLDWKEHLNKLCTKITQNIGILRKVGYILPVQNLITLFYSLVFSHINYCVTSWGSPDTKGITKLKNLICKCVNFINKKTTDTNQFDPLNIHNIYKLESCKLIYNFLNETVPKSLSDLFKRSATTRATRQTIQNGISNIYPNQADTPLMFYGPQIWNKEQCFNFANSSYACFSSTLKKKLKSN